MEVKQLIHITREEDGLYYRRKFYAEAEIQLPTQIIKTPITFCIEKGALGKTSIDVFLNEDINYPVLPITNSIKKIVNSYDSEGKLP